MAVARPFHPFLQGGVMPNGSPYTAPMFNPTPMAQQQLMPAGPPMRPTMTPQLMGAQPMGPMQTFGAPLQVPTGGAPLGAGAMPGGPPPGAPPQGMGGRISNFLGSDAALAMAAGILEGGTSGQAIGRGFNYALQAKNKATATTDDITEYSYAKQQGYEGTFPEFLLASKKAGAQNINIGGEGGDFYKELDKGGAQMFNELLTNGVQAENKLLKIDQLDGLLSGMPTGATASMKQIAGEWGVPTEGLDEIQAATAIINQMVPQQRPPGSGPMSDRDVELFKASVPRIINQPGGNKIILETMRGVAEYEAAQGAIAAAVANREISPAEGRAQLASLTNPLESFRANGPAPARRKYNPATGQLE